MKQNCSNLQRRSSLRTKVSVLLLTLGLVMSTAVAQSDDLISLHMRDARLTEVMGMLARQHRVNILLAEGVDADVSFNLYDVTLDSAIRSIATAAGFAVERRQATYFVLPESRAGKMPGSGFTIVKSIPVQYVDASALENDLSDYMSEYGNITVLPDRKLLVIEDQPDYVTRISRIVQELDRQPQQVLIEAKILEISLSDEQSYGVDWNRLFTMGNDGSGDYGTQGLLTPGNTGNAGFFFNYLEPNIDFALRALSADGRVRNLASPKVVTVVNQEAEVIIGDRRGYRVTTTVNQVTTESIEFLESGTILRVTPTIDESGKIMLNIHPEVSTGTVDENGVPSQTTTEVTTSLLVASGQPIFIGGLIRNTTNETRTGVPVLGRVPGVRWLFSNQSRTSLNTETVVIITPRLVDEDVLAMNAAANMHFEEHNEEMQEHAETIEQAIEETFPTKESATGDNDQVDSGVDATQNNTTASLSDSGDQLVLDDEPVVDAAPLSELNSDQADNVAASNKESSQSLPVEQPVDQAVDQAVNQAVNKVEPIAEVLATEATDNNRPSEAGPPATDKASIALPGNMPTSTQPTSPELEREVDQPVDPETSLVTIEPVIQETQESEPVAGLETLLTETTSEITPDIATASFPIIPMENVTENLLAEAAEPEVFHIPPIENSNANLDHSDYAIEPAIEEQDYQADLGATESAAGAAPAEEIVPEAVAKLPEERVGFAIDLLWVRSATTHEKSSCGGPSSQQFSRVLSDTQSFNVVQWCAPGVVASGPEFASLQNR